MKSLLERTFHEYYMPDDAESHKYHELRDAANLKFINELLKLKGWITIEKICDILGISIDPDVIEDTFVFRIMDGKKLDIVKEQIGAYMYRFHFIVVEDKDNDN